MKNKKYIFRIGENCVEKSALYFTDKDNVHLYHQHGDTLFRVNPSVDAIVVHINDRYGDRYKTDKLIVLCEAYDEPFDLEIIQRDRDLLRYAKQTPELCLAAVKWNVYALKYVKDQTLEICIEAVKRRWFALRFVKEQTPEICLVAVQQNGSALRYMKEQTPEICLAAVQRDEYALKYVKEQNLEVCLAAVGKIDL